MKKPINKTGVKTIKKMILEIGFHHSWGYYIKNGGPKEYRIKVNKRSLNVTKQGHIWEGRDTLAFSKLELSEIRKYLVDYFGLNC